MKYKKGRQLRTEEAFAFIGMGIPVWYEISHHSKGVLTFKHGVGFEFCGSPCDMRLREPIYEAIEVPEYNLNFMEAWEEMKKGKAAEGESGTRYFMMGDHLTLGGTNWSIGASKDVVEGKYRVVEGA